MDVVLGVAVTGPVARLALVGPGAQGADVIDQSVVDLADNPIGTLTETVVGTNRLLAGENHRLVGTRLCWTDHPAADQLRRALEDSGVHNVAVLSESQAVAALMRAAGRPGAALVMDDATATLSMVGSADGDPDAPPTVLASQPLAGASGGDATAAFHTMMANLRAHPDAPQDVYLLGASPDLDRVADELRDSPTMRVRVADDPTFALARGAAIAAAPAAALLAGDATAMAPAVGLTGDETAMAPAAGDATAMAPAFGEATAMAPAAGTTGDETTVVPASEFADPNAEDHQLAYSMADEGEQYPGEFDEYDPELDDYEYGDVDEDAPTKLSRRSLVIGNAVIAFAVIGLASLATAIAVAVEPTASQKPVVGVQNGTPGKFMPILPSQQLAPLPPPPVDQPNAGFQGGTVPAPNNPIPQQVAPPSGGGVPAAPVPQVPVNPPSVVPNPDPGWAPRPNPIVPIPIPIPIPIPGWGPNYPPYTPPYTPPSTTPTTTPYTPPTSSLQPPSTTTYSPPTTTYSPPSTTHEPPTTTYSPPTTTYSPPSTTHEPPTSTYSPPSTNATTQAPQPTHTQQTVPPTHSQPLFPQEPRPHRGF
ncbi:hypothetical protein MMAN_33220 [Mycobacterium mantenii]|uniref:DUF7159 domain-containing protein n=2 Tax=Mycobacterium mantenii TaxID=560555 RepID=A0ABM7JV04_MYCNT|nr:hypothetical protein [Mycobacterium mantenii]MCV7244300.1 hypothetical protein [Mycobacterium mantenii]BBY39188.1 hypothetical protein MMAN_33220 [Mycobacterium mantenii]